MNESMSLGHTQQPPGCPVVLLISRSAQVQTQQAADSTTLGCTREKVRLSLLNIENKHKRDLGL